MDNGYGISFRDTEGTLLGETGVIARSAISALEIGARCINVRLGDLRDLIGFKVDRLTDDDDIVSVVIVERCSLVGDGDWGLTDGDWSIAITRRNKEAS